MIYREFLSKVSSFENDGNAYASDYRDINVLKEIADRHKIAILLIHHLRKMNDNDPFNIVSGTTGLTGAVDGRFVLMKDKCSTNKAKLYATGRDIEYMELNLEFDKEQFIWKLISRDDGDDGKNPAVSRNPVVEAITKLVSAHGNWSDTASELIDILREYATDFPMQPNSLSKALNQNREELQLVSIKYDYKRTSQKKLMYLSKINDGDDSNDGKSEVPQGE